MTLKDYHKCHPDFRLNDTSFDTPTDLLEFSKNISDSYYRFLKDWFNQDDYILVHTSGSTGTPKSIQLKKSHMINSALATGAYFDLREKTTALLCLSTDFIAGKMMLVRAMVLGWHLDSIAPISNPLKNKDKAYDFCAMVPIQVYQSLQDLYKIKKLIVGGGVVSKELEVQLQQITTEVYATYGMTETVTHIAIKKLNGTSLPEGTTKQSVEPKEQITSPLKEDRKDIYTVLPNVNISKDERDCLIIDAPKISDNVITTNDLVEIVSKASFKWLGRYDNIINSGGVKLIPEQIEEKLSTIIEERFFVAAIPDAILGEQLVLIIEKEETSKDVISTPSLRGRNLKALSKYEIPKEIYYTPKFIETETKKIQRKQTLDLVLKKS